MMPLIIVSSILLGLLLILFLFLLLVYFIVLYLPKKGRDDEYRIEGVLKQLDRDTFIASINKLRAIPYEDLYIKSFDGLKLHAYFYENKNSDQYVLLFNGFRGNPRRDYCARAMDLIDSGRNVILCDQRAHGLSEGHTVTLGRKEQFDVVSWVKYVQERFGKSARITVGGTSLGASTVLLASDKLPPEEKVFADSCYPSQKDITKHIAERRGLVPSIAWSLLYLSALIFAHVRLKDDASINIAKSKCQILLVQCTADTISPVEMNERLFEVNKEHVEVVFFENLQHAMAYFKENEKYKKMFYAFLDK